MPELEQKLTQWRRRMQAAGLKASRLAELESHLREEIGARMASGLSEAEAFDVAVSCLGEPARLRAEFAKVDAGSWAVTAGSWLWGGLMAAMAVLLARRAVSGSLNWLLWAHIVTLTAGYCAALLAGGFGVYSVVRCSFAKTSPDSQPLLYRATGRFNYIAALLIIPGFVLGVVWSAQHLGMVPWTAPRMMGTLCATVWILSLTALQHFRRLSEPALMLLSVTGNLVMSIAWFGAGMLDHGVRGMQLLTFWVLTLFLVVHAGVLVKGMVLRPAR